MAKPDWGALQHQFLAEHAKSGISPKDWCEAQGLNYTSARRYIKKPTAQKAAQKEVRKVRCHTWLWLRLLHHLTVILRRKARAS
ncbi:hypothetical protein H4O05_09955 [Citrobacter freundii]|uniref:hypothetical protein n=1 Tax=Citrobacter freundii TaxID=546 RepID=UPI001625F866|nr:hypothetical protein H4O05_09955 [Citrobacter freundii]